MSHITYIILEDPHHSQVQESPPNAKTIPSIHPRAPCKEHWWLAWYNRDHDSVWSLDDVQHPWALSTSLGAPLHLCAYTSRSVLTPRRYLCWALCYVSNMRYGHDRAHSRHDHSWQYHTIRDAHLTCDGDGGETRQCINLGPTIRFERVPLIHYRRLSLSLSQMTLHNHLR